MANVSGVPVENISSLSGVDVSSTSNLMGVPTSNIPGWPSGVSCTPIALGYSDGRRDPYQAACTNFPIVWDQDSSNGALYIPGQCGVTNAPAGFYSDGRTIYFYDGANSFFPIDSCPR